MGAADFRSSKSDRHDSVKIKPLPLSERLQRLDKYYPAHPEFPKCAIRALAETPVSVFLAAFEQARDKLSIVLDIDADVLAQMTYAQLADAIQPFWQFRNEFEVADVSISLLASPYAYIDGLPRKGDEHGQRKIVP